jgi:hypothetical protein
MFIQFQDEWGIHVTPTHRKNVIPARLDTLNKTRRNRANFIELFVQSQLTPQQPTVKMPTRLTKTRKHRGHVSAGHGRVGTSIWEWNDDKSGKANI